MSVFQARFYHHNEGGINNQGIGIEYYENGRWVSYGWIPAGQRSIWLLDFRTTSGYPEIAPILLKDVSGTNGTMGIVINNPHFWEMYMVWYDSRNYYEMHSNRACVIPPTWLRYYGNVWYIPTRLDNAGDYGFTFDIRNLNTQIPGNFASTPKSYIVRVEESNGTNNAVIRSGDRSNVVFTYGASNGRVGIVNVLGGISEVTGEAVEPVTRQINASYAGLFVFYVHNHGGQMVRVKLLNQGDGHEFKPAVNGNSINKETVINPNATNASGGDNYFVILNAGEEYLIEIWPRLTN